jgi:hypothetical protein
MDFTVHLYGGAYTPYPVNSCGPIFSVEMSIRRHFECRAQHGWLLLLFVDVTA